MKMKKIHKTFGAREAAKLSQLSNAMVDYLCRTGVLIPTARAPRGRGIPRLYSFGDVVMLRALSRFLQAGLSVSKLKKALRGLRKRHSEIRPDALPASLLVTDGTRVF